MSIFSTTKDVSVFVLKAAFILGLFIGWLKLTEIYGLVSWLLVVILFAWWDIRQRQDRIEDRVAQLADSVRAMSNGAHLDSE